MEGGGRRRSSPLPGIAPVTSNGAKPDFPHSSPESDVEEETMFPSWKQILRLLTQWDPVIHLVASFRNGHE